jgi:hypothetical protein
MKSTASVNDLLEAITAANAAVARESFAVFRRTMRPGMLWSPFVGQYTRELEKFHRAFVAGKRPKLAIMTPPQHGKTWGVEDFIAWNAGLHPNWKTIYASYSDDLGMLRNFNLKRLLQSERYRNIFPSFRIDKPGVAVQQQPHRIRRRPWIVPQHHGQRPDHRHGTKPRRARRLRQGSCRGQQQDQARSHLALVH